MIQGLNCPENFTLGWDVSENLSLKFFLNLLGYQFDSENQLYVTRYGGVDDTVGEYIGGSNSLLLMIDIQCKASE